MFTVRGDTDMMYGQTLSSLSTNEVIPTLWKPPGVWLLPGEQRDLKSQPTYHDSLSLSSGRHLSILTKGPCLVKCHGLLVTSSACKLFVEASRHPLTRSLFPSAPKCMRCLQGYASLSLHWGGRPLWSLLCHTSLAGPGAVLQLICTSSLPLTTREFSQVPVL